MLVFTFLSACLVNRELDEQRKEDLSDHDGDSFAQEDDCDDADPSIFPGAQEVCDGEDQDCDEDVDESAVDAPVWYPDADVDDYGDSAAVGAPSCEAPAGYVANALDCDDASTRVNPAATETAYDGVDDDCDGADLTDVDGDGYTAEAFGGDDCDDSDIAVNPAAVEVPYDGVDQDCAGGDADDLDGDGSAALEGGGDDCDDADAKVNRSAEETWADGFTDNDCDGENEAVVLEFGGSVWSGWRAGDHQGRRVAALGDLDGDALQDVREPPPDHVRARPRSQRPGRASAQAAAATLRSSAQRLGSRSP